MDKRVAFVLFFYNNYFHRSNKTRNNCENNNYSLATDGYGGI